MFNHLASLVVTDNNALTRGILDFMFHHLASFVVNNNNALTRGIDGDAFGTQEPSNAQSGSESSSFLAGSMNRDPFIFVVRDE